MERKSLTGKIAAMTPTQSPEEQRMLETKLWFIKWSGIYGAIMLGLEVTGIFHIAPRLLSHALNIEPPIELPGNWIVHVIVAILPFAVAVTILSPDTPKILAGLKSRWNGRNDDA